MMLRRAYKPKRVVFLKVQRSLQTAHSSFWNLIPLHVGILRMLLFHNHSWSMLLMFGTQLAPIHLATNPHTTWTTEQEKKRCSTVYFILCEQKWQEGSPLNFRFIRLSFVRITLFSRSHIRIFIFDGIFPLQICLKCGPFTSVISML